MFSFFDLNNDLLVLVLVFPCPDREWRSDGFDSKLEFEFELYSSTKVKNKEQRKIVNLFQLL